MGIIEDCFDLLNQYGIVVENYVNQQFVNETGIGDLLFYKLLQENGVVGKIYINIAVMQKYFNNLLNALEFRIKLIKDLDFDVGFIFSPNINKNNVSYMDRVKTHIHNMKILKQLSDLPYFVSEIGSDYICFHTKFRLISELLHKVPIIKNRLREFCSNYRSKYTIVFLGEKTFPQTFEGKLLGITTVYEELSLLKNNNNVVDLTQDSIYDTLDYNSFKRDVSIIQNAKTNISIGSGGTLCMEITLGKNGTRNIVYTDTLDLSFWFNSNKFDDTILHTDLQNFFNDIESIP